MRQPHDSWATFYDFVYQQTYGNIYNELTSKNLEAINNFLPTGKIIDFGAGTGRLAIPLTEQGYSLVAVEKSIGMVKEFKRKIEKRNLKIDIRNCSISEYENGKADLAIALFTVLSYSITEEELSRNIENICKYVNPIGYFFFDLPNMNFFNKPGPVIKQTSNFRRTIELISTSENNTYTYREQCSGIFNGQTFNYEDEFKIRYWELSTLDKLLKENGFIDTSKCFPQFDFSGSIYKLYRRQ